MLYLLHGVVNFAMNPVAMENAGKSMTELEGSHIMLLQIVILLALSAKIT